MSDSNMKNAWLKAMRLRTLPLAIAGIFMGIVLWIWQEHVNIVISVLCVLTALSLQILSNFANDLGDSQNGADNSSRIGPKRAVQSGIIAPAQMLRAIKLMVGISLMLGIGLIWTAFGLQMLLWAAIFLIIGVLAIWAALKYTMGNNPYGYMGFGDLFVFLFFGLVAVFGTFFLHSHDLQLALLFPACAVGFMSTAVLNLNNMRDIGSDEAAGKITIPVRLGLANAKRYHYALIMGAVLCLVFFNILYFGLSTVYWKKYLFLLWLYLAVPMLVKISRIDHNQAFDPFLKQTALLTLLLVFLFGFGLML